MSSKDEMIVDLMNTIKQNSQWKSNLYTNPIPADIFETPNSLIDINSKKKKNCSTDTRVLETAV